MFHSVSLLGACPQPCGKHADTVDLLYYYFNIKEEHCKMYDDKIISEYTLKLTKLCHFKKISRRNIMPPKHSIYRMIETPVTLTISLCLYKK